MSASRRSSVIHVQKYPSNILDNDVIENLNKISTVEFVKPGFGRKNTYSVEKANQLYVVGKLSDIQVKYD